MKSFVNYPSDSDFSIYNIPFGVAVFNKEYVACATRIGDQVVDLATLYDFGYFDDLEGLIENVFEAYTLNEFIELGKPITNAVRLKIQELLLEQSTLSQDEKSIEECFYDLDKIEMLMPIHINNHTIFNSCLENATNIGNILGNPDNPLPENWLYMPTAQHSRASSVVVSGVDFHRPKGQIKPKDSLFPQFQATNQLDFELQMAYVINKNTEFGESLGTKDAEDAIFGLVLYNNWCARDIQNWEQKPLGPFSGINFCSSISPWVVTLEALEEFRAETPRQQPEVLDYLKFDGNKNFDIHLNVYLKPENSKESHICSTNFKNIYWNLPQQLAQHTSNGCNIEVGDLYATGSISGKENTSYGSLLELTWNGLNPLKLSDGAERRYLENNDTVIMRGFAEKNEVRIGFGEVSAKVLPAL